MKILRSARFFPGILKPGTTTEASSMAPTVSPNREKVL